MSELRSVKGTENRKLWNLLDDSCRRLAGVEICVRTEKEIKNVANLRFLIVH
jgi:hypothetical protein